MTPITEEMLNSGYWIDLAQRHVRCDWSSEKPDGYLKAVIGVALDYRQQVISDLARESAAMPEIQRADVGYIADVCFSDEVRESIASLQAKLEQEQRLTKQQSDNVIWQAGRIAELLGELEQSEARAQKIREAVDDAAYEWSQYVEVDRAPMTLQKYIAQAIDAALNKEPGHEA